MFSIERELALLSAFRLSKLPLRFRAIGTLTVCSLAKKRVFFGKVRLREKYNDHPLTAPFLCRKAVTFSHTEVTEPE